MSNKLATEEMTACPSCGDLTFNVADCFHCIGKKAEPEAEHGSLLTVKKLRHKLGIHSGDSAVRLHFFVNNDTNQPAAVILQVQERTGKVRDLWVWDGFTMQEVDIDSPESRIKTEAANA